MRNGSCEAKYSPTATVVNLTVTGDRTALCTPPRLFCGDLLTALSKISELAANFSQSNLTYNVYLRSTETHYIFQRDVAKNHWPGPMPRDMQPMFAIRIM